MSLSKTLGTLILASLVGSLSILIGVPKKNVKNKEKTTKASTQNGIEEKYDLFI